MQFDSANGQRISLILNKTKPVSRKLVSGCLGQEWYACAPPDQMTYPYAAAERTLYTRKRVTIQ